MSYTLPSVQVNQRLTSSGGVAQVTPDLNAVIVGPLYNVISNDLSDVIAAARSQALTDVAWQTDFSAGTVQVELPNFISGQRLDVPTLKVAVSNAYVKVNDFKADLSGLVSKPDPAERSKITILAGVGSPHFALNSVGPDGKAPLQVGDRLTYSLSVTGPVTVSYSTTVRAVDIATGEITLSNAIVEDLLVTNTAVVFTVYRNFDALNIPVGDATFTPISNVVSTLLADSAYTVGIKQTLSAFPTSSDNTYFTLQDVGSLNIGYRALRTDLSQTVVDVNVDTLGSLLGDAVVENPLALATQIALSNTTTLVKALSLESDDFASYQAALEVLESDNSVYALAPLTQSKAVHQLFKTHVTQLSTPLENSWRMALVNTVIPTELYITTASDALPGSAFVRQIAGGFTYLIDPQADFLGSGVVGTDLVTIKSFTLGGATLPDGTSEADFIGTWVVNNVIDATTLQITSTDPAYSFNYTTGANQSSAEVAPYFIKRVLLKSAQAEQVAATSTDFGSNRVIHVQPDSVSVEVGGATVAGLPGYYLAAALAGSIAGSPVQQGFTNAALAGISDLQNANYYFKRNDLNTMAAAGTCLYVQSTQGGVPYCRHELTTDVTTLEYREILKVKNWDYVSYYVHGLLKPFVGSWNIVEDTLNTVRTTLIAGMELLMQQRLPKIGAPLLSYTILKLEQSTVNKDRIVVQIRITLVDPANYFDVNLEI